ncbi:MAG: carboxypeptidase regulatory-like domain-containing protein [Acidobacteria bacterium]|nr:carboxypeptidase regulatory-like domain-containing protein [Acidobacteriota bacterium]
MRKLAILLAVTAATNLYAAITGTVVDPDAKPIAGATIRAYAPENSAALRARILAGKIDREPIASVKSAENGTFSLDVKDAVAVDVVVDAPSHPRISIATVDGDDLGAILLASAPSRMLRVTSGGKPVANAIVVSGADISRTNAAGEVPAPSGSPTYVVSPDFAIARSDPANSFEVKLTRGVAVSGRVTNPAGPVAHAVISINGWPLAESGNDGTFTISHAPDRWQAISAIRGSEVGIAMRPKTGAVEIRLTPGATFASTVRDTNRGGAVAGARMTITTPTTDDESMTTVTDAKGAFTIGPLLPHLYQIGGVHPAFAIESASVTLPATRSRAFAAQAFARAKGRVIDEERKGVAAAVVTASSINTSRGRSAVTSANGEFAVRVVPSGTFPTSVLASKRDYVAASSAARSWKAGEVKDDIVITLAHGFVAQVRVIDKQKQPVPNAQVNLSKLSDLGMQRSTTVACADPSKADCHRTGADGIVSVRTTEGRHEVRVSGDDIGPFRLANQVFTARAATVVVTVDRGISVSGRVVRPDGTPVSLAVVDAPTMFAPRTADTNADGTFTLNGLAAGPAVLTAHSIDGNLSSPPVTVTAPAKDVTITIPRGARIEGRVLDRATQQPVTDFAVSLPARSQRPFVATTARDEKPIHADDGSYAIDNVPPGAVDLTVRANGYVTGARGDINAEDGKTVTGIDIQLDRGATISGRVTSHGTAIAGAEVRQASQQRGPQAGPQMGGGVTTDADGLYKLDGIAEGARLIEFHKTGFITAQKPVDVKSGKDVQLDAELDPGHELRGRVADRSGRGVAGANIRATGVGERRFDNMIVSDSDGSFVLAGLADGRYQVTAQKEGMVSADASDVDLPQTRPLTLTLDAGATITGLVTGITPEELTQVVVTASGGTSRNQTYTDTSGNFSLPGLPDGQVRVDAFLVTAGRRRMAPAKTIVVENGVAPAVEINFEEGINVSGRVTKGGVPVPYGSVAFSPSGGRTGDRQFVSAMISPDGTYTAAGLSIGDYTVRVNGPNVSQYQTKYTASVSATFDIDIHGATLRGRVVDARSGAPVADARVLLMSRLPANGSARTDSDGRFAIDAMPDATYDLQVNREQYAVASQPVVITNGSTPDVEVRLEQVAPITIHVADSSTGAPVDVNVMISDSTRAFRAEIARVEPGTWRAWLKPGTYSASVGGPGYVFKTQSFTAPGDDVTIQIVHAGTLLIQARTAQRARLDFASGGTQRFFGPLHPGTNGPFESIPPGSYVLVLLATDGKVAQSIAVVINAGQTATIDTP